MVLLNRHYLSLDPSGTHNLTVYWKAVGIPAADKVCTSAAMCENMRVLSRRVGVGAEYLNLLQC